MPTIIECICCWECENMLEEKLDRVKCITEEETFLTLCLNKIVLNIIPQYFVHLKDKNNYKVIVTKNMISNLLNIYKSLFYCDKIFLFFVVFVALMYNFYLLGSYKYETNCVFFIVF